MNSRSVIWIAILLFCGLVISEIPTLLRISFPETANIQYNIFIQKSYNEKITVLWYIYELGHILNRIIWIFVFCQLAFRLSRRLFLIGLTFLAYQICNFFLYIWDRNTSSINNLILYCIIGVILVEILIPVKSTAKIKYIDDTPFG